MGSKHVADIEEAIAALVTIRRAEVVQIRNNATNPDAREKLVAIQATIEALRSACAHEGELAEAANSSG